MNAPIAFGDLAATVARSDSEVEASLSFARGGGRTFLARQSVPYPFHITRPHRLDAARPDIATLYLQSASGGLYRGDRLALSIEARPGVCAHVTSQAATVAHRATAESIRVSSRLTVHSRATLALTTDPYVMFPGARLAVSTEVVLHRGASALLAEGFAAHDPSGGAATFEALETMVRVRTENGRTLVEDRSLFRGADFAGLGGALGGSRALGSVLILGGTVDPEALQSRLDGIGILSGASRLPNEAGWSMRLLAEGGGALARGLELAFAAGFEALTGCLPARRRK
jgi:urease accessory protein